MIRRTLRIGITIAAALVRSAVVHGQTPEPCDENRAQSEQFTTRVVVIGPRLPAAVPILDGAPFLISTVTTTEESLQSALDEAVEHEEPARFRLAAVAVRCVSMNSATKTVTVEVRTDRLAVPEGNTAGEIIDEASRFRLAGTQQYPRASVRGDFDDRLGALAGIRVEDRLSRRRGSREIRPVEDHIFGPISFGGWRAFGQDEDWYHVSLDASGVAFTGDARGLHIGSEQQYWLEKVPFATGTMTSKGLSIGTFYEWQVGGADLRANVGLRFQSVGLTGAAGSRLRQRELAVESAFQQEFIGHGGFFRYGGWTDHGFGDASGFTRGGLFTRIYQDFPIGVLGSWGFDLVGTGGRSGDVPSYRMFTGGNRLDPFLADRIHPPAEYTWAGPVLRGYGVSSFALPLSFPRVAGMSYGGVSATVLLPGRSLPLVEPVDALQKAQIDRLIQDAFDVSVADMMTRRMRHGVSAQKARRRSLSEGRQLRNVLENLIRHGRRFSARPLFIIDAAQLRGDATLRAASIGGGLRLTGLSAGAELLVIRNIDRRPDALLPASTTRVLVRGYYRSGVRR